MDTTFLRSLSEHDFAGQWIDALFDSVPLQIGFAVYNNLLLLLLTACVAYGTLAGIVASARDGVPLGKKIDTTWVPIRIVVAVGLLAPIGPHYLGAAQLGIYNLARAGSGFANEIWASMANSILIDGYAIDVPSRVGSGLVRDVVLSEVCQAARERIEVPQSRFAPSPPPPVAGVETPRGVTWRYADACGTIRLPPVGNAEFEAARRDAAARVVGEVRTFVESAIQALVPGPESLALDYSPETALTLAEYLHSLAREYESAVGDAAAKAAASRQADERRRVAEYMRQHGWTTAGMAFRPIAEASALAAELAAARHERIEDSENLLATRTVRQAVDAIAGYLNLGEREIELRAGDLTAVADAESDFLGRVTAPLREAVVWAATGDGDDIDPVAALTTWGHGLMLAGEAVLVGGVAAGFVAKNLASDAAGADGAFDWSAPLARTLAILSIVAGIALAFVLPLLPYIFTVFAALAFLIAVGEALIAVPLWCVALASMRGEDFLSHRAVAGAQLVLGLTLRPALAVLSIGASLVIVPVLLRFVYETLPLAAMGGQGGHIVGLVLALSTVFASVYVAWEVTKRSYALITAMPARIMEWFGVQSTSRGEDSNSLAVLGGLLALTQQGANALPHATRKPPISVSRRRSGGQGESVGGARAPRGRDGGAREAGD